MPERRKHPKVAVSRTLWPVPVPLFDTRTPLAPLREQILGRLADVVDDGRYILGPNVAAFEGEFASYVGAEHAIGVGAAFDFHAGLIPQAPAWMQRTGLEWAFRLVQEPRRLWRRYARHNPRFVAAFARQWAGSRRGRVAR